MSLTTATSSSQLFAGRYNLLRNIGLNTGGGAAGEAWLARDTRASQAADELVVVKISTYDSGTIYQVRTEARVLQRLRDAIQQDPRSDPAWTGRAVPIPWLFDGPVPLHDGASPRAQDSVDRPVYLVEEYIAEPFIPLPALVRGRAGWSELNALELADALGRMLRVAHRAEIIHGDLNDRKVEHIFWDPRGRRLKVIDWGIADDPHVVERRHLRNDDIQGLGTLFHYMMTGEPHGRRTSLPGWAQQIVQSCLDQDPTQASLEEPMRQISAMRNQLAAQAETRARAVLTLLASKESLGATDQVRGHVEALAQIDPHHPVLGDPEWLIEGRETILGALERFDSQLAGMLTLFAVASGEPRNARASAAVVATRARELGDLVTRARQLDRDVIEAFAHALHGRALRIDWAQLATIFDLAAKGTFTFHAPEGLSAEPWSSFTVALRSLDLPRSANFLTAEPSLADPDPFRAALRAPELKYLLLAAWYGVHPLTDVERHVGFGRAWSGVSGNVTAMSRGALERWLALLDTAEQVTQALREVHAPGDVASRWGALVTTVRGLQADSPVRVTHDAPLDDAYAVLERTSPQIEALTETWRAGQYEQLGQAVDTLVAELPELEPGLAEWVTGGQRLRECLAHAERLRDEIADAAEVGGDIGAAANRLLSRLDALQQLDPGAPWHTATRAALLALIDLTRDEQSAARRRLGWQGMAALALALATQRQQLAVLGANGQLGDTIQICSLPFSGPIDAEALAAYERDAAGLGPLRPAFDAELVSAHAATASRHAEDGEWSLAAGAYEAAAKIAEQIGPEQGAAHTANAAAARAIAAAFAALVNGRFDDASNRLDRARGATNLSRAIAGRIADASASIEMIVRHARLLSDALRTGGASPRLREHTRAMRLALDEPAVPVAVRDEVMTIVQTCDQALGTGQQTPTLARFFQSLGASDQNEWRDLVGWLMRALPPPARAETDVLPMVGGRMPPPSPVAGTSVTSRRVSPLVAGIVGIVCLLGVSIGVGAYLLRGQSTSGAGPASSSSSSTPGPTGLVAPAPGAIDLAEREADGIIADARKLTEGDKPDADLAVQRLDGLRQRLAENSPKRQAADDLLVKTLMEDGERRVALAFVMKPEAQGRNSRRVLDEAKQRFDRAASLRPNDAAVKERTDKGRDQVELMGWWLDFDAAYQAKDLDKQIDAVQKIVAKNPEYSTPEGSAKEKLYAAWIAKADKAWDERRPEDARAALAEAAKVDPGHPVAGEKLQAWFPPTAAPVAAPPTAAPALSGPAAAPASKPAAPKPVAPAAAKPAAPAQEGVQPAPGQQEPGGQTAPAQPPVNGPAPGSILNTTSDVPEPATVQAPAAKPAAPPATEEKPPAPPPPPPPPPPPAANKPSGGTQLQPAGGGFVSNDSGGGGNVSNSGSGGGDSGNNSGSGE